ncbi:MAG TPA: FAD-dependent oxidoreductase [Solirubrobacterales bacterium]|nr:FAD-dependent oxidoreductase [Solirubrobacterales bacterium]
MKNGEQFKVVVAGAGVAAVEAMLALRDLAAAEIELELVAPNDELVLPALGVAEPFGIAAPPSMAVADVCDDLNAVHRRDALQSIEPGARTARTESGAELPFDALLVAIGASAEPALPGALTYRGRRDNDEISALLLAAEEGQVRHITFAVPTSIQWPLPIYELSLLTAIELRKRQADTHLALVTHESSPLGLFGTRASRGVGQLLHDAGVELVTQARAAGMQGGGLALHDGRILPTDRVVASPRLTVPEIGGIPQGPDGFIGTDLQMRVEGTPRVYASGDATWFPIKQGGIAAQQADVAASAIAALVKPDVEVERFQPTLRGVLFTGGAPHYLRAEVGGRQATSAESTAALWWPPAKVAGRHLAPYLANRGVDVSLEDLEPLHGESPEEAENDQRAALELALAAADADARWRDYQGALRWLDVAQDLNIGLPTEYAEKRRDWQAASPGD